MNDWSHENGKLVIHYQGKNEESKHYILKKDREEEKKEPGDAKDGEDIDGEDKVIDVAEQVFIKIAEEAIKQGRTSCREIFHEKIYETEIQGQVYELLKGDDFLLCIKALGIESLTEAQSECVLRVLTKPDLENAIVVAELL